MALAPFYVRGICQTQFKREPLTGLRVNEKTATKAKQIIGGSLPLMIPHIVNVRQNHQGHTPLRVQRLRQIGMKPRAVHHQISLRSFLGSGFASSRPGWRATRTLVT